MKPVSSKFIFAEVAEVFRCIHTLFNAAQRDMECFNQLQMQCFDILNIKHWILIFKIIVKIKIDFKCKIKPPAGGSTSLVISESLRLTWII